MIKNNSELTEASKVPLDTCLTIMTIVVHSGASRQGNHKKERNTTTKAVNSTANKKTTRNTISWKTILPFQTGKVLKESLYMFDT